MKQQPPIGPLGAAVKLTPARSLQFWRGGTQRIQMAYQTWGQLNAGRDNAVLVLPGLSPDTHMASSDSESRPGWWENMVGAGKAIDTDRFFVMTINHLGSCFGSTGPASLDDRGKPFALRFPELSMEDLAAGASYVLDHLGLDCVHSIIAPSMGGLVAQAFMLRYPNRFNRALIIASALRAEAHSIAIHSLQRDAIRNDPTWNHGQYDTSNPPLAGMRLARKIGMSSYRSSLEWEKRFANHRTVKKDAQPFQYEFEVESYLAAVAERFVTRFDANAYLYLSRAMDWFDATQHGRDAVDAFTKLAGKCIEIIGISSDTLFPLRQQQDMVGVLQAAGVQAELHLVDSQKGHDAFLVDTDKFGRLVADFLESPIQKRLSVVS